MRIPGKTMDDHLADVARQLPEGSFVDMQDVECNADIYPSQVFLEYRTGFDRENPHRPYMHIVGECRGIRKADGTPFVGDVTELTFDEGEGIGIDAFYEFSDEELSHMVSLGMYRRGFECPSIIRESELELPVYCELRIVEPQAEGDVPLVFANIEDRHTVPLDSESCGYTFGDYFEEAKRPEETFEDDFDIYGDYGDFEQDDLFSDERQHTDEAEVEHEAPELSDFDKAVAEHYENVRERVESEHVNARPKLAKDAEKEAAAEVEVGMAPESEPEVEVVEAEQASDEFEDFDAEPERSDEVARETEADGTEAEDEAVVEEQTLDGELSDEDDEKRDEARAIGAAKRQDIVEDNQQANAEDDAVIEDFDEDGVPDDEEKPVHAARPIPSSVADVAQRAQHARVEDTQYDE